MKTSGHYKSESCALPPPCILERVCAYRGREQTLYTHTPFLLMTRAFLVMTDALVFVLTTLLDFFHKKLLLVGLESACSLSWM